jgi:cytochrome c peroxidase
MKILQLLLLLLIFHNGVYAAGNSGLPPVPIPADNPQTAEKIALGQLLFNDKRFSGDGSISCSSCHIPEKAFTDGLAVAKGIYQQTGTRNSPTIVNAAFYTRLFLDGREPSLEKQALGPLTNPIEHGLKDHQQIVDIVRRDPSYQNQFTKVFGIATDKITINHVVKAIASFERTLVTGNSAFDDYFFNAKRSRLSASAARGEKIFRRKGNCANCHEISWNNALFTDNQFYNIGVGFKRLQPVLDKFLAALATGQNPANFKLTDFQRSELGRFNVTTVISDIGKFKTPTLRNIALTAPYMHDGSVQTLEEVVEYYDQGGEKNRFLDPAIFPLKLTAQEKKDLVAFMQSLTSPQYLKFQ